jgi:hypothetical protein
MENKRLWRLSLRLTMILPSIVGQSAHHDHCDVTVEILSHCGSSHHGPLSLRVLEQVAKHVVCIVFWLIYVKDRRGVSA